MSASASEMVRITTRASASAAPDSTRRLHSRQNRHVEIHHHEVRAQLGGHAHAGLAVGCFTDDLEAVLVQNAAQPPAEQGVVVHQENAESEEVSHRMTSMPE